MIKLSPTERKSLFQRSSTECWLHGENNSLKDENFCVIWEKGTDRILWGLRGRGRHTPGGRMKKAPQRPRRSTGCSHQGWEGRQQGWQAGESPCWMVTLRQEARGAWGQGASTPAWPHLGQEFPAGMPWAQQSDWVAGAALPAFHPWELWPLKLLPDSTTKRLWGAKLPPSALMTTALGNRVPCENGLGHCVHISHSKTSAKSKHGRKGWKEGREEERWKDGMYCLSWELSLS